MTSMILARIVRPILLIGAVIVLAGASNDPSPCCFNTSGLNICPNPSDQFVFSDMRRNQVAYSI